MFVFFSSNGRAPVSSKPPLPPQPPRVAALGTTTRASASRRRAATDLGNPAAIEMAKARAMQAAQERPVGLLETDLDEAVIDTSCTKYIAGSTAAAAAAAAAGAGDKKTRSLLDLNHTSAAAPRPRPEHALHVPQSPVDRSPRDDVASAATSAIHQRPHKSMEFLLDKENLHFVKVSVISRSRRFISRRLISDMRCDEREKSGRTAREIPEFIDRS